MLILLRALTYATIFIGVLLFLVPAQILDGTGITQPDFPGTAQWAGLVMAVAGLALAVGCVLTFVFVGKGTAAPFDPPRRLVVRGPYQYVRNPMYIGAGILLGGGALYYGSPWLLAYLGVLWLLVHLLVVFYEEPTLHRLFGRDYEDYTRRVRRWLPAVATQQVYWLMMAALFLVFIAILLGEQIGRAHV